MTPSTPPTGLRSSRWVVTGCALLAACVLVTSAAAAGVWYLRRGQARAAEPAVEYILDASPRMSEPAQGSTRLGVARAVLSEIVRPADTSVSAALRVFGTGKLPEACRDTDLLVALAPDSQARISDQLLALQASASAGAALGEAMVAAIRDLAQTRGPHSLVVVTGGADTCNAEAGQLIAQEAKKAGIELQLFVVGYQVSDADSAAIKSIVDETSGGTYLTAADEAGLHKVLASIQARVDNPAGITVANVIATARAAEPTATPGAATVNTPVSGAGSGLLKLSVLAYQGASAEQGGRLTVQAFSPQDHEVPLATDYNNPASLALPAGRYDVRLSYLVGGFSPYLGGTVDQWIEGLSIEAGQTNSQSYDLQLGEAHIFALEAAGQPVPDGNLGFALRIFNQGDLTATAATIIVTNTGVLQLAPGIYEIQADFPGTTLIKTDQSAQIFEVKAGQRVDYALNLKLGHLRVEVDDEAGQPLDPARFFSNAYPAGQPEQPFAYAFNANPADLPLQAGARYDLILTLDNAKELLLTNQQVQEGESRVLKISVRDFK